MRPVKRQITIALALMIFGGSSCAVLHNEPRVQEKPSESRSFIENKRIASLKKDVVGTVESIFGITEVVREGRVLGPNEFAPAHRSQIVFSDRLFEGDSLITKRSRVHASFKDGTLVELGEWTSFRVHRIRFASTDPFPNMSKFVENDESVFHFDHGIVRMRSNKVGEKERFIVRTADYLIKAAGPVELFIVQMEGMRNLNLKVIRGEVLIINTITNDKSTAREATGVELRPTGLISDTGPFTPKLLDFLMSRTRI